MKKVARYRFKVKKNRQGKFKLKVINSITQQIYLAYPVEFGNYYTGSLFHWDPGNQINPSNSINPSNCSTATRHNSSTPLISQGVRRKARGATAKLKCLRSKERSPCGTQDVSSPSPTGVFYSSITRPVLPNARFHGASSRFEAKLEPPTRETQSTQ